MIRILFFLLANLALPGWLLGVATTGAPGSPAEPRAAACWQVPSRAPARALSHHQPAADVTDDSQADDAGPDGPGFAPAARQLLPSGGPGCLTGVAFYLAGLPGRCPHHPARNLPLLLGGADSDPHQPTLA